jgi:hypothetical protein
MQAEHVENKGTRIVFMANEIINNDGNKQIPQGAAVGQRAPLGITLELGWYFSHCVLLLREVVKGYGKYI